MTTPIHSNNGHSNNGVSNNGHPQNGHFHSGQQQEEEKPIDIHRILSLLRRYWILLIFFPVVSVALAIVYTRYAISQYKITSTILIKKDDNQQNSRSNIAFDPSSLFTGNASNVADEIEILKSRTLMAEVLGELKINPTIYAIGRLRNTQYYNDCPIAIDTFWLSAKAKEQNKEITIKIDIKDNQGFEAIKDKKKVTGQFDVPFQIDSCFFVLKKIQEDNQKAFLISIKGVEPLCKEYLGKLTVTPIKGAGGAGNSNAILITLVDELPKRSINIATNLIEAYNRFGIEDKNSGDKNALKFIDARINLLTGEVNSGEKDIERYKKSQGIIADATSGVNYTLEKLGASDNKITELEIKKAVLNSLSESLNKPNIANDFSLMPINLVENNSSIALQIAEYNKLISDRLRLLKFAQKENTSVVLLESQILNSKALIKENIEATLKNLQQQISFSLAKFKSDNINADQELRKTPSKERGLLEITRLKNLKESIYLFLLQKREETALSLATTVANARVLDSATSTTSPISPNKVKIIAIALIIGLIIPLIIIYMIVLLNNSIESEDDIRSQTTTPFLGYVTMGEKNNNQIVVEKGSRTATAETFRLLRSNLQFMLASSDNKTVLITSSMSGEGKSFITVNLGVSLALTNKKTIILGFDLRKPQLTNYLQNTSDKADNQGLTNYLVGDVSFEQIIHQSKVNDFLYYISSGPIPPNPAELIMQERTDKLFEYLRTRFDFIIIDTPPVGIVVDANLLAKYATASLYVTRFGVTKKAQLRIIDSLYKEKRLPNASIVLNAVKTGRGYSYNYGYNYGYGYGEDIKTKTLVQRLKGMLSK